MTFRSGSKKALFCLSLGISLASAASARAELTLYEKDGWTLKHGGLAQGFYMLSMGDTIPTGSDINPVISFGGYGTVPGGTDNKFISSRFRSGWTGGRFNWVASKKMSDRLTASAVLGIAYSVSTYNAPTNPGGPWDIRNGFVKLEGPWGELAVGRSVGLYTLGSIISTINMTSAAMGLGNTCGTGGDGLSCYTSGYGVKFPGFWAGVYYTTPNMHGLTIKVAAMDPTAAGGAVNAPAPMGMTGAPASQRFAVTPLPMFQTMIRYEGDLGFLKLIPYFNGFTQKVGKQGTSDTLMPFGLGGGLDVVAGPFKIGGGGTWENGTSMYGPLYSPDVIDGVGKLRKGSSFFVHALYSLGSVDISGGYGQTGIDRSDNDLAMNFNINKMQSNIYGAVQYHLDPLTFVAEVNILHHEWYLGNKQDNQIFNLGANFAY